MKQRTSASFSLLPLLLASCAAAGRTTTADERALLLGILTNVNTAIVLAQTANQISPQEAKLATDEVSGLRARIVASDVTPIAWQDLVNDALRIAIEWKVRPR